MGIDRVSITAVLDRNETGVTRPFICRCSDGFNYFVKGRDAGIEAMCNELIAGQIARDLDLPIPEFRIVEIPEELIAGSLRDDIRDLGHSSAWGLREVLQTEVFSDLHLPDADEETCIKVLLFDWFVENSDRGTSRSNLLWSALSRSLYVIDHNLAFDDEFDAEVFWREHMMRSFRERALTEWRDKPFKSTLERCILNMAEYFENVPQEWREAENFDFGKYQERIVAILKRLNGHPELFWEGRI